MATATTVIDEPGIYDLPASVYHQDCCPEPSLSASIASKLCLASAAHAAYAHPRLHPGALAEESEAFDVGTAAHAILLEGVRNVVVVDAPDWRTKAAREARDQARAAGQVPLLTHKWHDVEGMIAAARQQLDHHADGGGAMFTNGKPEQTLVWVEDGDGDPVWCRARLDWLRPGNIDDYKSCGGSANPEIWTRSMFGLGLDIQAAWYLRGVKALTGIDATFRFCVQETSRPYALAVVGLAPDALMLAEKKVHYALEVWRDARRRNEWVGYPRRTCWATLPAWEEARWLAKEVET